MNADKMIATEKSPSRLQTDNQLQLLCKDFSVSLEISEADLLPILTRSFTEQVGSEIFFRPNALPYLYRAKQLEGKLSLKPEELKDQLGNSWLMIVDIANLKKINELPGSGHSIGDQVIDLHIRSVIESTEEDESSHCLVRFMGDEFADFFNDPQQSYTPEKINELIAKKTADLLEQAKNNPLHPLYNLATYHPELIGKVVQFARLKDIQVPGQEQRMDDMVEVMFEAAEKGEKSSTTKLSTDKQILNDIAEWGLPSPDSTTDTPSISAIDTIVKAITATDLKITLSEEVLRKNDQRRQVIERHLPDSISATWKKLIEHVNSDPQKTARIIGLFEESLFNNQFSRNPPILNDWVYDELSKTMKDRLTTTQMVSSPFSKLSNSLWGRIVTTNRLKHSAKRTLTLLGNDVGEDNQLDYIIKKQGASFYLLSTPEKSSKFRSDIKKDNQSVIKKIAQAKSLKEFFTLSKDLLFYTPMTLSFRTEDTNFDAKMDSLRSLHYLGEIAHLVRACREYKNQSVYDLMLYFISERPTDRLAKTEGRKNLESLSTLLKSFTREFITGKDSQQSPQPRPPSSSALV